MSDPSTHPLPDTGPGGEAERAPETSVTGAADQEPLREGDGVADPSAPPIPALSAQAASVATSSFFETLGAHNENTRPVVPYSRFVELMKVLLPGLAGIVFVSIIAVTFLFHDDKNISVVIPSEPAEVQNELMETPELSGFDDKGRPYKVTARTAQRNQEHEQLIALTDLQAWMLQKMDQALDAETPVAEQIDDTPGNEITVTSRTGLLNTEKQTLALEGNVVLSDSHSYTIKTNAALVDIAQRQVSGTEPVHVAMDWGTVDADGFEAFEAQQKVVFKGNVKTIAY